MKSSDPIARLNISDSAMRNFFQRDGKNLRVKIENNMIYLKSTSYEGRGDTIVMTRNRNVHVGDIAPTTFGGRFMDAINSAGFRPDQPYFKLVAMDRRWIGLEHLSHLSSKPDDATEYLHLIAYEQAALSHKRYLQTKRAIEQIKANLPVLSEWDLHQIIPRAMALTDDIRAIQHRLFPQKAVLSGPWLSGRVVTVADVARVLQDQPRPGERPPHVEPLSDEAAEAIIFEVIDG
jgi:hypothetical protein